MPYLSITDAARLSGKSEKTIRRLIKKPESKNYISIEEGKIFVDSDYIDHVYKIVHDFVPTQNSVVYPEQTIQDPLSTQTRQTPGQIEQVSTQEPGHVYPELGVEPGQSNSLSTQTGQVSTPKVVEDVLPKEYYLNLIAAKEVTIQIVNEQLQSKEQQLQVKDQQLLAKDQQLQMKDQQLNQLIERDRESNIIIQSLQEKVTRQIGPPQSTEPSIQSIQKKDEAKTPLVDKLLIGVAVVVSVALLLFFGILFLAYINK